MKALIKEEITREMGTYFEMNDKEHPTYNNLQVQLKLFKRKLTASRGFLEKKEDLSE